MYGAFAHDHFMWQNQPWRRPDQLLVGTGTEAAALLSFVEDQHAVYSNPILLEGEALEEVYGWSNDKL
jgi:hypothetical protein